MNLSRAFRLPLSRRISLPTSRVRSYVTSFDNSKDLLESKRAAYEAKYADKLKKKVTESGASDIEELKAKLKRQQESSSTSTATLQPVASSVQHASKKEHRTKTPTKSRKDSSPIKPLSATLNIPRILSTPHTPAQISALWNAYHASQSSGTGRGYLSATVPFNLYEKMLERAKKYPLFVLPLPREAAGVDEGSDKPVEFHLMEWGFHGSPPHPSSFEAPSLLDGTFVLDSPHPPPPPVSPEKPLPAITTILFTSLQEYKLHQSYAQPRLVLTHYTDLVQTHGIVLLRGEITQGTTDGRYTMSQIDAQMLALGVQRFYLGDDTGREELLKSFHEKPNEFEWERVIEKADIGVRL